MSHPLKPIWEPDEGLWMFPHNPVDWVQEHGGVFNPEPEVHNGPAALVALMPDGSKIGIGITSPIVEVARGGTEEFFAPNQRWSWRPDANGDWTPSEEVLVCLGGHNSVGRMTSSTIAWPDGMVVADEWVGDDLTRTVMTPDDGVVVHPPRLNHKGLEVSGTAVVHMLERMAHRASRNDPWTWDVGDEVARIVSSQVTERFGVRL